MNFCIQPWHNLAAKNNLSSFKSFRIILITLYNLQNVPYTFVSSPKYTILPHLGNHWQEQQSSYFNPPKNDTIITSLLISNSMVQLSLNLGMDWKITNSVKTVPLCMCMYRERERGEGGWESKNDSKQLTALTIQLWYRVTKTWLLVHTVKYETHVLLM